jgi:phosphatidylcholine synthase
MVRTIGGYLVHAYTACGAVCGWLALAAVFDSDYRRALAWLIVATAIDASDGVLARLADVARTAPLIDGARLDDIVDYLTYVFVPGAIMWHAGVLPPAAASFVVAGMLVASACGFARVDAKTDDHLFTGFPSYWNIVAVYFLALRTPKMVNALVLVALSVLVFVPIRCVYPSRTRELMRITVPFGIVWSVCMLAVVWFLPDPPRWLVYTTLPFVAYYVALSVWLTAKRSQG